MSKNMNVPKLRFSEFCGEWEEKLFGNIVTNKSKKYNPEKETISYKCIELEHLSTENGQLLGYVDSLNSGSIKNKFNKNDVLFGKLRPYLKKYLLSPFDGVCSSEIWVLNGTNITNSFLYYIVQSDYFIGLANQSSGSKMPRADWNIIENSIFFIPSKPEQEKIASFLTSVDTKIEQLTKKEALLQEYKKGVMSKIFNQEIRFKDDDGSEFPEWEENTLGDACKLQGGYAFKSEKFSQKGIPVIRISNISNKNNYIDEKNIVCYEEISNDKNFTIKKGDLIVAMSGATTGKSSIYNLDKKAYLNQRVGLFRADVNKLDYGFLIQFIFSKFFSKQLDGVLVAGAQPNISSKDIENFILMLPFIQEQTKIANFLSTIDKKIELTKKELNSTKEFKKALLQQMFV